MEGVDLANDPDRGSRVSRGSNGGCGNYRFPEARAKSWRQSWRGAGLDNHGSCELWLGSLDSWPPPDAEHGAAGASSHKRRMRHYWSSAGTSELRGFPATVYVRLLIYAQQRG